MIKKEWPLQRSGFVMMLTVVFGLGAAGIGMHTFIMRISDDPGQWFCMGTLMALLGLLCITLIGRGLGFSFSCQLALSMGQRRRDYAAVSLFYTALQAAAGYAAAWLVFLLEQWMNPLLYPGVGEDADLSALFSWQVILAAIVSLVVLSFFVGALQGRYGRRGLIWLYVLWMVCCLALPRIIDDTADGSASVFGQLGQFILRIFHGVPALALFVLAAAALLVMLIVAVRLTMRQEVKL